MKNKKNNNTPKIKLDTARYSMVYWYRGVLIAVLAGLSIYKPLALFQSLSLLQTFLNIACNYIIYYSVGAAVWAHNLF